MAAAAEHAAEDVTGLTVGILGGTGDQGRGLAYRLARAGQRVVLGSRSAERAAGAAAELRAHAGAAGTGWDDRLTGADNAACAAAADLVIVAVPWEGHRELLEALREPLRGKLVVDCVNPLGFDAKGPYPLRPEEGSAAEQAAVVLPESRVTAAFHHLSAVLLLDTTVERFDTAVLVLGEDRAAVETVRALAARIPGMRGVYAGRLRNAHQVEALTANLIAINRRYKAHAGIRITDLDL